MSLCSMVAFSREAEHKVSNCVLHPFGGAAGTTTLTENSLEEQTEKFDLSGE